MLTPAEIAEAKEDAASLRRALKTQSIEATTWLVLAAAHLDSLLDHIQAQSEQLRQAQAEGAVLRQAVKSGVESCRLFKEQVPKGSVTAGAFAGSFWPFERSADEALSSAPAITAYAARVARMKEALREIAEESPVRLDGWARQRALAALAEGER